MDPDANRNRVPETGDKALKSLERLSHPPSIDNKAVMASLMQTKVAKK
jgi:hypothetical protein